MKTFCITTLHSPQAAAVTITTQSFDIMPIHDMLVTEHWYIVLLGPVKVCAYVHVRACENEWECVRQSGALHVLSPALLKEL